MTMDWLDRSVMRAGYRSECGRKWSTPHHVGLPGALEVPHVDALGPTHPNPPSQRLMHVAEQRGARAVAPDQREQVLRAGLRPPGMHVVEQFGDSGRDVAAQHVHSAQRRNSRCVLLRRAQVRTEHWLAPRHDPAR